MKEMQVMTSLEKELEKRLEETCQRNDWTATADIRFGTTIASLTLEKFSKEPIDPKDYRDAHMSLCDFIIAELNIHYIEHEKVFTELNEEIPNTITPYHYSINAKLDIEEWIKKNSPID